MYADYDDLEALWKDEPQADQEVEELRTHLEGKPEGKDGEEIVHQERDIRCGKLEREGKGLLSSWQAHFCRLTT